MVGRGFAQMDADLKTIAWASPYSVVPAKAGIPALVPLGPRSGQVIH